ncbi:hypothetical protein I2F27_10840 [Acinetobacter sp. B5B]|uniref:hypothetical protein n=1 Tax=Acinetobacter baretiae TaxID=2605383 RepID=UPI0018C30CBE|nr:hypothetical protein [Acinetobacter baretiae]MBF7683813.1 hypothetical protein [Acinetobacter baretiae]MBF7686113.1 hypothetical protein [Acinetobacter baretiae]
MRHIVCRFVASMLFIPSLTWAVESSAPPTQQPTTTIPTNPSSSVTATPTVRKGPAPLVEPNSPAQLAQKKAEDDLKIKALVKNQETRMQQLEKANLDALARNQELQLKNDNLGVQVQVLQSERTAQLFMYGAATLGVGVLFGFILAGYIYSKRRRQW